MQKQTAKLEVEHGTVNVRIIDSGKCEDGYEWVTIVPLDEKDFFPVFLSVTLAGANNHE